MEKEKESEMETLSLYWGIYGSKIESGIHSPTIKSQMVDIMEHDIDSYRVL